MKILDTEQFESRKRDHIRLALLDENQALGLSGFDRIELCHNALPDLNFEDISLHHHRLKHQTTTPFYVNSMTAGHHEAININETLARACEQQGWAMGVGSQRRQLTDTNTFNEWTRLRECAPSIQLFANIGISQAIEVSTAQLQNLVDSIQATALFIHCNALQECLQPEGTPNFSNAYPAIERICQELSVPVVIKETGCGFSKQTLQQLNQLPIAALDISGLGGTHWGRIEGARSIKDVMRQKAAVTFANWGISTMSTLLSARTLPLKYEVWGSGGVRNGLDAAKCLAYGADSVGIAKPLLEAAINGVEDVLLCMQQFEFELRIALFCTGSRTIAQLKETTL